MPLLLFNVNLLNILNQNDVYLKFFPFDHRIFTGFLSNLVDIILSEPEAKQYSVRFYNGTDLISSVETSGNEVIDTPNLTAPEHFAFGGWYLDKDVWQQNFTGKEYEQKPLTSDLDVYAKWTQTEFQVSFEENGGETVQDGWFATIEKAPVSKYDGFILDGWYTDKNLENPAVFPMTLKENTTLYAKWIKSPALLSLEGFTLEGNKATANTTYTDSTDSIDLSNAITVSKGAQWALYSDENCQNTISASDVSLNAGTNRYYLKVSVKDVFQVYELVIQKTGGYALTVYENGEESTTLYANKGDTFEKPTPKLYVKNFRFDGEYFSDADITVPFNDFKADTNKTVYMKIWYVGFDYSKVIFTIEEALDSDKPILYAKIPSQIDGSPVYFLSSSFQNNFRFKRDLKEVVVEPGIWSSLPA